MKHSSEYEIAKQAMLKLHELQKETLTTAAPTILQMIETIDQYKVCRKAFERVLDMTEYLELSAELLKHLDETDKWMNYRSDVELRKN